MSRLMRNLFARLEAPEGDGSGGGATPTAAPAKGPETFSREYVEELRHENGNYRTKAKSEAEARAKAEEAAKAAQAEADAKVTAANQAANERIIRAELKAAALKAGMVDMDGLKLADLSKVKLNDAGEVEGAEALMEEMKKAKPYLFGAASSASTHQAPAKGDVQPKDAKSMTTEEYRKARQDAINASKRR